ncbi:MAG: asparagine synthase C-terminal domain-containing protein, partial [Nanoarchaeota archaeon]
EIIEKKEEAKRNLKEKFISALKERLPAEKFGLFFSGGIDSTFIAAACKVLGKKPGKDFICYTVGFQEDTKEPEDVLEAKKIAKELGFKLKHRIYNLNEAEEIIKKTVKILKNVKKADVVNAGVGAVVLAAIELGKKDNLRYFFSGLGSEEIFAGYERHAKVKNVADVNEECWQGLKSMWGRDLVRDFHLAKELNVAIATPFLDKELIRYTMTIPGEWKIRDDVKKVILREVAEEFLGKFAWRKKKAAQYGSCFDKAISKLARRNGFKLKKEWLEKL